MSDTVEDLVTDLEAQLSQESAEAELADAVRSHSDDEIDEDFTDFPDESPRWVENLLERTRELQLKSPTCSKQLTVLSACTGTCAEGHVLDVASPHFMTLLPKF